MSSEFRDSRFEIRCAIMNQMSATIKCRGIVLKTAPFGEADKLLTVLLEGRGKLKVLAKGARKPKSKFGGRLELGTYLDLLLAPGRTFLILTQCEICESFYDQKLGLELLELVSYLLFITERALVEGQINDQMVNLLLSALTALKRGESLAWVRKHFQTRLLEIEGVHFGKGVITEEKFKKIYYDYVG